MQRLKLILLVLILCGGVTTSAHAFMPMLGYWQQAIAALLNQAYSWGRGTGNTGALGNTRTISFFPNLISGGWGDWQQISAGRYLHGCGIRNSIAYCWGDAAFGKVGDGSGTNQPTPVPVSGGYTKWTKISAGYNHSCGITSGTLLCWGRNDSGQLGSSVANASTTPAAVSTTFTDWTDISAAFTHTCALRGTGTAYCWGSSDSGEAGNGIALSDLYSPNLGGGNFTDWTSITTGSAFTCGLRGGVAYCWGDASSGKLGNGTTSPNPTTPSLVLGGWSDWTKISAGQSHACGIRNGIAYCWGDNLYGKLGNNTGANISSPSVVSKGYTDWIDISAGNTHTCGVRAGGATYCWGSGVSGTLGDNQPDATTPTQVITTGATIISWTTVSTGGATSCGIAANRAYCWGSNGYSSIGTGDGLPHTTPTLVAGGWTDWSKLSINAYTACGIRSGTAYCWGSDSFGALGNGSVLTASMVTPSLVLGGWTDWSAVTVGQSNVCGLRGGVAYCWGVANTGAVGDGQTAANRSSPSLVLGGFTDWSSLTAGASHVCGIRNGSAYCWGTGSNGRLGNSATAVVSSPTLVLGGFTDWTKLSGGETHTCGIRNSIAYCWGSPASGKLGDGQSSTNRTTPTLVLGGFTDWTDISAGTAQSCGIRSGTLWCWGSNLYSRTGNGVTALTSTTPTLVLGGLTDWTAVSTGPANGATHTCAIRSNSSSPLMYCWGSVGALANMGEIGNETILQVRTPKLVSWTDPQNVIAISAGGNFTYVIVTPTTP